jgi:hypothetical protein
MDEQRYVVCGLRGETWGKIVSSKDTAHNEAQAIAKANPGEVFYVCEVKPIDLVEYRYHIQTL